MKRTNINDRSGFKTSFWLISTIVLLANPVFVYGDDAVPTPPVAEDYHSTPLSGIGTLKSTLVNNQGSEIQTNYQAGYSREVVRGGNTVTWLGMLDALFVDDAGRFREDGNANAQLDTDCTVDPVVEFSFSESSDVTFIRLSGSSCDTQGSAQPIDQLRPIWSAQKQLAEINPTQQRGYNSIVNGSASGGRYIFTSMGGSQIDFDRSRINVNNYHLFNVGSDSEAADIVDFIRGKEGISGFRNRAISSKAWRLGDIVNSTPLVVDKPTGNYDVRYNDPTYTAFKAKYQNRRRMVYVGANDGLLHAFNAGFWNPTNQKFELKNDGNEVEHPLGAEIWAYAPENLLPHLQWLTEADYEHIYYVDGAPQAFDVNIFPSDNVHPNGWGTILVVGMRLGGGPISGDFRSAYIVLDITDPESPPELIAEISPDHLNYTTSQPALVKKRVAGPGNDWFHPSVNEWQLVFGSGPNQLSGVFSDMPDYNLFQYDLISSAISETSVGAENQFVGAINSTDLNDDFQDDMLYFGTVARTPASVSAGGELMRAQLGTTLSVSRVLNADQPIFNRPITTTDDKGAHWVYVGSGILFTEDDRSSAADGTFYGIKEPVSAGNLSFSQVPMGELVDTTNVQVFEDGSLDNGPTIEVDGEDRVASTFSMLEHGIEGQSGWLRELGDSQDASGSKVLSSANRLGNTLFYTTYTASSGEVGSSELTALYYKTGTASPSSILGQDTNVVNVASQPLSVTTIDLGPGANNEPNVIMAPSGVPAIVVPDSVGGLSYLPLSTAPVIGGRKSWRILPL